MKRILHISFLTLLLGLLMAPESSAQRRDSGSRSLYLWGSPNVQLEIDPTAQGSEAQDEDDSTYLIWGRGSSQSKITVSTFSPGQQFDLFVEATGVSQAKSTGRIQLRDGMQETTLLTKVKKDKYGSARLVYTASASIESGSSEYGMGDVHTITYTVTDL
jgi:hypothetical protein